MKGLVIRWFSDKCILCTGKAPEGKENDGNLYIGDIIQVFDTWEAANQMRKTITAAYQA